MKNRCLKKQGNKQKKIKGIGGLSKKEYKEHKISQGISKTFIFQDCDGNFFIPYCSYGRHIGVIGKEKLEEKNCSSFGCKYYHTFILNEKHIKKPYTCLGLDSSLN